MSGLVLIGMLASVALIGAGLWFGWQLLRQNGRVLSRLDELEKRLDELEFDESSNGQRDDVLNENPEIRNPKSEIDQSVVGSAAARRLGNRSLSRSKIKRDGLKAGTPAPDFRLPRLDGGELSLQSLLGQRVLLVFSDPHCGPCSALAPHLEKFHRAHPRIDVAMISRGEPRENRAKVKAHGLTFPVVLQHHWEVSRLYAMFATPIAYLIDESGVITSDVAVGVEPILKLMAQSVESASEPVETLP